MLLLAVPVIYPDPPYIYDCLFTLPNSKYELFHLSMSYVASLIEPVVPFMIVNLLESPNVTPVAPQFTYAVEPKPIEPVTPCIILNLLESPNVTPVAPQFTNVASVEPIIPLDVLILSNELLICKYELADPTPLKSTLLLYQENESLNSSIDLGIFCTFNSGSFNVLSLPASIRISFVYDFILNLFVNLLDGVLILSWSYNPININSEISTAWAVEPIFVIFLSSIEVAPTEPIIRPLVPTFVIAFWIIENLGTCEISSSSPVIPKYDDDHVGSPINILFLWAFAGIK